MSVPTIVNDGDFTVDQQHGGWVYSNPLSDKGDFAHLVATRTVRIDVSSFTPSSHTSLETRNFTTGDGVVTGYLVGFTDPVAAGNNVLEWEEKYATLPSTRTQPTTVTYTQQFLFYTANADQSTTISILEYTNKRAATETYEYYFKNSPLPVLLAPKLEQIGNRILFFGDWRPFAAGEQVLTEDSTSERYLGDIYVRKTTRIAWVPALPFTPPPQNTAGTFNV
jgi:hypothetical protein